MKLRPEIQTNYNILHLKQINAVCLRYVSVCLFDRVFLYLKLAYACTSTFNLHFIHLGTGQVCFSFPPPPPQKKSYITTQYGKHCVTILHDEEYHTLYRSPCNAWTKIKKSTIVWQCG